MNADFIQTLSDAGYKLLDCENGFYCIEDPTCIWPPILEFVNNAWIILTIITAFLLAGWGITMLRGANHDMVKNLRTLVLIFGVLSAAIPAVNVLGLGEAIVSECETIKIAQTQIDELLQMRDIHMENPTYEHFEVLDSAFDDI